MTPHSLGWPVGASLLPAFCDSSLPTFAVERHSRLNCLRRLPPSPAVSRAHRLHRQRPEGPLALRRVVRREAAWRLQHNRPFAGLDACLLSRALANDISTEGAMSQAHDSLDPTSIYATAKHPRPYLAAQRFRRNRAHRLAPVPMREHLLGASKPPKTCT